MVVWSTPATLDLRAIHDFIALESKYYAVKVIEDIIELSEKIEPMSARGRIVPEFGDPRVRELFIYSYRLIYEIGEENVSILAVIHGKRDISKKAFEEIK